MICWIRLKKLLCLLPIITTGFPLLSCGIGCLGHHQCRCWHRSCSQGPGWLVSYTSLIPSSSSLFSLGVLARMACGGFYSYLNLCRRSKWVELLMSWILYNFRSRKLQSWWRKLEDRSVPMTISWIFLFIKYFHPVLVHFFPVLSHHFSFLLLWTNSGGDWSLYHGLARHHRPWSDSHNRC